MPGPVAGHPILICASSEKGQDARRLGRALKDEPETLPGEVGSIVRRSFRRVWDARGGGLYAVGFVVTFVYLEVKMFIVDIFQLHWLVSWAYPYVRRRSWADCELFLADRLSIRFSISLPACQFVCFRLSSVIQFNHASI